jgi:hypothetical protein
MGCLTCGKSAIYGEVGTRLGIYCADHKPVNHIDVVNIKCRYNYCPKYPSFGVRNTCTALFCGDHCPTTNDYINVMYPMCRDLVCETLATFGKPGTKIAEYCFKHKDDDYVDVMNRKCLKCTKRPNFGQLGSCYAEYCFDHCPEGYVDVTHIKCRAEGCPLRPNFASDREQRPIYCATHKPDDYIDVTHKTCLKCTKRPNYGKIGTKLAEYCVSHIPKDDIKSYCNVLSKLCIECNVTQPCYGDPIIRIAECCKGCAPPHYIDVKNKICDGRQGKCITRASFGPLFGKKKHCAGCMSHNEYLKNNPKCEIGKCPWKPFYTNLASNYPIRCEKHMQTGDKNVVERPCGSCGLSFYIRDGNMCNDCSAFFKQKVGKVKELKVKQLLELNGFKFTHDKIPQAGCYKYRPDFQIDAIHSMIIVEVDENQHKSYACECEIARMISLFQEYGGMTVIFIRYNPDSYINNLGDKKTGSSGINERRLIDCINSLKQHQLSCPLSVVYLCYDDDDGSAKVINIDYEKSIIKDMGIVEQSTIKDMGIVKQSAPSVRNIKLKIRVKIAKKIPIKLKSQ